MIVLVVVVCVVLPLSSVTVNVTVYEPAFVYAWLTVTPVPTLLSPKFQAYVVIVPSGSVDPLASKLIIVPVGAVVMDSVNVAMGGRSVMVLVAVGAVVFPPSLSVAVTVTEYDPAFA